MLDNKKSKLKELAIDALCFVVGSILYAFAYDIFVVPNKIVPGGVSGIGIILYYKLNKCLEVGTWTNILNIPLVLWALVEFWGRWRKFIKFTGLSLVGMFMSNAAVDFFNGEEGFIKLPAFEGDPIVLVLFSAVLCGVGLGMIFSRGGTTAGTDLIAKLTKLHARHISLGNLLFVADTIVVILGSLILGNPDEGATGFQTLGRVETFVYTMIFILINAKVADFIIDETYKGSGKFMMIVSEKSKDVYDSVLSILHRKATKLKVDTDDGQGKDVLLCAMRQHEVHKAYDIVKDIDDKAFVVVTGGRSEIRGSGFVSVDYDN